CGSVNTAGSKFCLSCGATMAAVQPEKKAAAEPQGPVCPACGSSNAGTGKFCLACGASMATTVVSQSEAQQSKAQPAEKKATAEPQAPVCPACGSSKAGTGKFCLACGASMVATVVSQSEAQQSKAQAPEKKAAAESQGSVCSACGASNPSTSKFCLSCGGSLMAGVQLFQPTETHASPAPVEPARVAAEAVPAAMAAQASVSAPVGQPLWATAPAASAEPPAQAPIASPPSPPITQEPAKPSAPPEVEQASLEWTASPPPPKTRQHSCAACGAALNAEQKFCLACGTPVGQTSSPAAIDAHEFTPAPPEHFQPAAPTQIFEPAPKSSSKAWIVVVLALAAAGTGGWFAWKYFTRPDVTVSASVQRIHVASGGKTSLEASVSGSSDTDVDWSIQEGQKGGQVTALGTVMSSGQLHSGALYTAPQASGTYHVIVTSHANPGRSAKIEIIVGGVVSPDNPATTSTPAPPSAATATTSTAPAATATSPASAYPNAAQIVGTWRGPSTDMMTTIGADSTIAMTSATNPQKNLSGTYHFTDNSHLDVDFGNGDTRKWEILGVDGAYLRVNSQSKDGSSAIIFQKAQ
ncbi:MAG TPA: zinc ribbon domain-containing protein, partial [Candidatus Angelobacter sp.]